MFKDFKNKRYWILMPPFLITSIILAIYLPPKLKPLALLSVIVFWIVYYVWNYFGKKKSR
ncbi:hypothetical protein [Gracilibacillus thailandensis]|jgi:Na+-transporting NADH:ubiquinone oxidoreductase subunit NqrB|uniref:Permease n=1 Tax=Gracilibacillus thailandensis TaxID=563735 RepID=A0A6N7QXA1_9BACI|nr:hypothetical protein [Gracilibacillus thailandensis]MRI66753.1 hypothetical protein [Gracilibacillus thailandensis]